MRAWVSIIQGGTPIITVEAGTIIHDENGEPHTVDDEHVIFKDGRLHMTAKVVKALEERVPLRLPEQGSDADMLFPWTRGT